MDVIMIIIMINDGKKVYLHWAKAEANSKASFFSLIFVIAQYKHLIGFSVDPSGSGGGFCEPEIEFEIFGRDWGTDKVDS